MGFMKRVAADLARFAAIASVVACTWVSVYWTFDGLLKWGPVGAAVIATFCSALNGITMGYNVAPLDTEG